jgi:hypothetical protein
VNEIRIQRAQINELLNTNSNIQLEFKAQQEATETGFHDAYRKIVELQAEINVLRSRPTSTTTGPTSTRTDDSEMKRIMNTNLLKGHEFNKFSKKDNYEIWIDSIKIDLFSQLPDARKFIEYAENPPDDHCTKDKNGHKHVTPQDIRKELNDGEIGVFDCSKKVAEQIDFKIYALLNNLTRDHPVAHGKIKHKNAETKYGTLAWHNLKNFYHETTVEYEMQCMKHALNVTKCGSMEQLAVRLDQWLYAVDKIAKLNPAKALPVDYQF